MSTAHMKCRFALLIRLQPGSSTGSLTDHLATVGAVVGGAFDVMGRGIGTLTLARLRDPARVRDEHPAPSTIDRSQMRYADSCAMCQVIRSKRWPMLFCGVVGHGHHALFQRQRDVADELRGLRTRPRGPPSFRR